MNRLPLKYPTFHIKALYLLNPNMISIELIGYLFRYYELLNSIDKTDSRRFFGNTNIKFIPA